MKTKDRAKSIITDILVNHLPRIKEGLEKGYVDENQILVIYDHAVRARILLEQSAHESRMSEALDHEIRLAEKQVELLKLRVSEGGHDHVKPFGSDAVKRVERLRAALSPENVKSDGNPTSGSQR